MSADEKNDGINIANWSKLAQLGSTNAISGLSQMVKEEMRVTALSLEEVSMQNASSLVGKADDLVVGIYLLFSGSTSGHIMLAFTPDTAFELVDMAMGRASGSTQELGEMERSVLGEMGNIVGSFFLNPIADDLGIKLVPTPPAVVMDMAGAVIGSVMAEVWCEHDTAWVIRLVFTTPHRLIEGRFLVLPSFNSSDPGLGHSGA